MVGAVTTKFVLFSETNSVFGAPVLSRLADHPAVDLPAVVVREPGRLCDYYLGDADQVDLAMQADSHGIRVLRPAQVNDPAVVEQLRKLEPDFFIVANYQQILRDELLGVPACDTINFHPSPLPCYAGLAPFYWMALNHETEGGVSAVKMTRGLDDGPIVAQHLLRLCGHETVAEIRDSHFHASWRLFDLVLPTLIDRTYRPVPQDATRRSYFSSPPHHAQPDEMLVDPATQKVM